VPIILGVLLGNQMEANLRRAMTISDGDWTALFASPLSITLWTIAFVGFVLPIILGPVLRRRMQMRKDAEGSAVD
jgi:putative tricarboxylic transport membrane protein